MVPITADVKKYGPRYIMAQSKPAKAFLIHECCWSLLIDHFTNEEEVNVDGLFEVCSNIPVSGRPIYNNELPVRTQYNDID